MAVEVKKEKEEMIQLPKEYMQTVLYLLAVGCDYSKSVNTTVPRFHERLSQDVQLMQETVQKLNSMLNGENQNDM